MSTGHGANDSSDEEGQAFYVGGSEHSGQQVVGPNKGKRGNLIQNLFDSARAHGAEPVSPGEASGPEPSQAKAFRGTGYRLGETNDDTEVIPDALTPQDPSQEVHLVLRLWKNGFSIKGPDDTEELKSYSDPNNAKLLNSIGKGEIPDELAALAKGGKVNMDMEDHRDQDFVPPKKVLKPFSGSGQALGSPTPQLMSTQPVSAGSVSNDSQQPAVTIDESQPITTLQIRLADGSRKVQKFNHSHTISDIRQFVASTPGYEASTFQLQTNFPVKVLDDDSQSIKDAQLLNAVIIQKLI